MTLSRRDFLAAIVIGGPTSLFAMRGKDYVVDNLAEFLAYTPPNALNIQRTADIPLHETSAQKNDDKPLEDGWYIQYSFNKDGAETSKNIERLSPIFPNVFRHPYKDGNRTLIGKYKSLDDAFEETDRITGVDEVGILEVSGGTIKWRLKPLIDKAETEPPASQLLGMPQDINKVFLEELNVYNAGARNFNRVYGKKKHEVDELLMRCILKAENSKYNPNEVHYRLFPKMLRNGRVKLVHVTDENGNLMYPSAYGLGGMTPKAMKHMGVALKNEKEIFGVRLNLRGAIRYNGWLMDRFHGEHNLVLAAYNAGPTSVGNLGRIPNNSQTARYISKITQMYQELKATG